MLKFEHLLAIEQDEEKIILQQAPFEDIDDFEKRVIIATDTQRKNNPHNAKRNNIFRRNLYILLMYLKALSTRQLPRNDAMTALGAKYDKILKTVNYKDEVKHPIVFQNIAKLLSFYYIDNDGNVMDKLTDKEVVLAGKLVERKFKCPYVDCEWLDYIDHCANNQIWNGQEKDDDTLKNLIIVGSVASYRCDYRKTNPPEWDTYVQDDDYFGPRPLARLTKHELNKLHLQYVNYNMNHHINRVFLRNSLIMRMEQLEEYAKKVKEGWKRQMLDEHEYVGPLPIALPAAVVAKERQHRRHREHERNSKPSVDVNSEHHFRETDEMLRLSDLLCEVPNMQDNASEDNQQNSKRKLDDYFPTQDGVLGPDGKNAIRKRNKQQEPSADAKAWEELYKEASQVSKIQFVPGKNGGCLNTFNIIIKNTVRERVPEEWIDAAFNVRFVEYVKKCGMLYQGRSYWIL